MASMKRLNKTLKTDIINTVITKTFREREAAIEKRRLELFKMAFIEAMPEGFAEAEKEHPDWFDHTGRISFQGEQDEQGKRRVMFSMYGDARRAPHSMIDYSYGIKVPVESLSRDLQIALDAYRIELKSCGQDKATLTKKVSAIVNSVTTVKRLKEAWPEVTDHYTFENPCENLPAIIPTEVNGLIASMAKAA